MQVDNRFAMGNRVGTGLVNISGGGLAITGDGSNEVGDNRENILYIGRGADWENSPGAGGTQTLRITGDDAVIAVGLDLRMDPDQVFQSATLVAELTGPTHTPILTGRNAEIENGIFKVELGDDYAPVSGDSWTIIQTGVDLTDAVATIDQMVADEGDLDINGDGAIDGSDILTHNTNDMAGSVIGEFKSVDTSMAPLANGLNWEVDYSDTSAVVLKVVGELAGLPGDYNDDGKVDLADYTVWRNNLGASITLDNEVADVTPGMVTVEDYTAWKDRFGDSTIVSLAVSSPNNVPEPSAGVIVFLGLVGVGTIALRKRNLK